MIRKILKNKPLVEEIKSETFLEKEAAFDELMEHDMVVRIPPKRRYTIQISIKNVRKGKPIIVEPEELL